MRWLFKTDILNLIFKEKTQEEQIWTLEPMRKNIDLQKSNQLHLELTEQKIFIHRRKQTKTDCTVELL